MSNTTLQRLTQSRVVYTDSFTYIYSSEKGDSANNTCTLVPTEMIDSLYDTEAGTISQ